MNIHSRGRPRTVRTLLVAVLALSMAATGLGPAHAAGAPVPGTGTGTGTGASGTLEGLEPDGTAVVHLLTGHEVRIESGLAGDYQVSATPPAGPDAAADLQVRAEEAPGQPVQLVADPPGTAGLVDAGQVDPHLFDLSYLLGHGHGVDSTPVTVHFQQESTPEQVAAAADALPGSELVVGTATAQRATVAVTAAPEATFWEAVTTVPEEYAADSVLAAYAPLELADGLAGLTLAGAALPEPVAPAATTPTYTLTLRIHGSEDQSRWPQVDQATLPSSFVLVPVTGLGTFTRTPALEYTCEDPECRTAVVSVDVAEGVWFLGGDIVERRYGRTHRTWFSEPEVVVDSDTTLDLYADDAVWFEPETPQPAELAGLVRTERRTRPDGTAFTNLLFSVGDGLNQGLSMAATRRPASAGAFNMMLTQVLQQPRVSLSVVRPKSDLALHPQYVKAVWWLYDDVVLEPDGATFALVDAGDGSEANFARIDARGKLVLLGLQDDETIGCQITEEVQQRARESGAAAVIVDPNDTFLDIGGRCNHPMGGGADAGMPYISVPPEEAAALREMLDRRRITIEVGSPANQRLEHVYVLGHHFVGGVPEQIDQAFTAKDLATRESRLHGTAGLGSSPLSGVPDVGMSAYSRTAQFNLIGAAGFRGFGTAEDAVRITEHIGPVSRDLSWNRSWNTTIGNESARDVFAEATTRVEHWLTPTQGFGVPQHPEANQAWPFPPYECNFCRMGDELIGTMGSVSGTEPHHTVPNGLSDPVLTDADGNVILPSTVHGFLPAYELPPETERYTLGGTDSYGTRYEWTFRSGAAADNSPPDTTCLRETYFDHPCGKPVPMIYLGHDTNLDVDNTAPAPGAHRMEVTAYHQDPDAPAIAGLRVWTSTDSGETWDKARVIPKGTGADGEQAFRVIAIYPGLARTDGTVSLKAEAWDADGNRIEQVIKDAFTLTEG